MGITKEAKLQRQIDEADANLRNANSSLAYVRTRRDEAVEQRDKATALTAHLDAVNTRHRQHIRRLFASIFTLNLELARKGGYIDRVKETESTNKVDITESELDRMWPEQEIAAARDDLAGARSERMVARVIDGMDSEVLDQVLGREPDAMDYDRG